MERNSPHCEPNKGNPHQLQPTTTSADLELTDDHYASNQQLQRQPLPRKITSGPQVTTKRLRKSTASSSRQSPWPENHQDKLKTQEGYHICWEHAGICQKINLDLQNDLNSCCFSYHNVSSATNFWIMQGLWSNHYVTSPIEMLKDLKIW